MLFNLRNNSTICAIAKRSCYLSSSIILTDSKGNSISLNACSYSTLIARLVFCFFITKNQPDKLVILILYIQRIPIGTHCALIEKRKISFERVVSQIKKHGYLDIINHPNIEKYPNQKMFILNIENYAYLVPFVESEEELFLKTIIPSRKATKKYIEEKS